MLSKGTEREILQPVEFQTDAVVLCNIRVFQAKSI